MAEQEIWLWYTLQTRKMTRHTAAKLQQKLGGVEQAYRMSKEELQAVLPAKYANVFTDKDLGAAHSIQRQCGDKDIQILTWDDEEYPAPLREIETPPLVLYVRGKIPDLTLAVTLVGTRKCTEYGRRVTGMLASQLAQMGCTIISGMALGIDGVANCAALDVGGATLAVLGCGVDVCYPPQNRALMERIVENGAVISEYPPGVEPVGYHFPERNRIMSGLSRCVVVTEAPERSGSLITARCAAEQGRDVFAVPGDIQSPTCQGCLQLLRDGAGLAANGQDILQNYTGLLQQELKVLRQTAEPSGLPTASLDDSVEKTRDSVKPQETVQTPKFPVLSHLPPDQRQIYEAVVQGADRPDLIIEHTDLTASQVMAAVTMMEIIGLLQRRNGRIFLNL